MKPKKGTKIGILLVVISTVMVASQSVIAVVCAIGLAWATSHIISYEWQRLEKKRYKAIKYTFTVGDTGIEIYPVTDGWDVAKYTQKYVKINVEQQKINTGKEGNTIVSWEKTAERKQTTEREYIRLNSVTLKKGEVKKLVNRLLNSDEIGIQNSQEVVKAIAKSRQKTKIQKLLKWAVGKLFVVKTGHKPLPHPTETAESTKPVTKPVKVIKKTKYNA